MITKYSVKALKNDILNSMSKYNKFAFFEVLKLKYNVVFITRVCRGHL